MDDGCAIGPAGGGKVSSIVRGPSAAGLTFSCTWAFSDGCDGALKASALAYSENVYRWQLIESSSEEIRNLTALMEGLELELELRHNNGINPVSKPAMPVITPSSTTVADHWQVLSIQNQIPRFAILKQGNVPDCVNIHRGNSYLQQLIPT
ncbi:hypothetical protein SAY87_024664 [Trapa incisa]|uniref:Uncharacterized protein n=1 Tax=Trapa incisa TaxID=236973 RepID=A0AAN7GD77_9MYRT|nr:hypothetical protein SAY87_024664 [Trapa incisa]